MLIYGRADNNRMQFLAGKYLDLISKKVKPEEIIAVFLNSYKKKMFIDKINSTNSDLDISKHKIYTFFGLCYNAFNDNWKYILKLFDLMPDNAVCEKPNLCGLEVSQFIFKQSIKEADFSDYISKINLLHQLFRRYSLTVQNCLANTEIKNLSKLLNETFYTDAQKAIDDYKIKTIKYNSFDYLRQLAVFPFIYKNTDYFKNIKYLIIDDFDEFSYALSAFIEYIFPYLEDYFIACDNSGSSRCGYLCAYKSGINEFIKKHSPEIIKLENNSIFLNKADEFYKKIKSGEKILSESIKYKTAVKRLDMIELALDYAVNLVKNGEKPCEISIITPVLDEILIRSLKFSNINMKFHILSGNEKLIQCNTIKYILIVLKLCSNFSVKEYELKSLLINLLQIPCKKCIEIINNYSKNHILTNCSFSQDNYNFAYKKLISLINSLLKSKNSLSDKIQIIYTNLIKEFQFNPDIEKYNFLIKEAKSFETAFNKDFTNNFTFNPNGNSPSFYECSYLEKEFITQIENSVISENPIETFKINKDAVIVSSPQKIIDFSIMTKYQIWLDISSSEWRKQDTGTLYNAWVFNRDWNKNEYTLEDNISLTRDKTARIIRKLMLCAKEEISLYSSLYDNTGNENFGGLDEFIVSKQSTKKEFKIIPRPDQKPVLDYQRGKMGIMAVPGAGKTTILLVLTIKLINNGINPENIFILTYMEAAAKNFKERIKSIISESSTLPNISTIHGLALRIIKENGNYTKAGLDENFEICDDNAKEKFIKELFYKLKIDDDKYDDFLRCISIVKLSNFKGELFSKFKEIQEFYNFFNEYNRFLKQNNYIDYDDMLCLALKILEENHEILTYYQNICRYIIEDEAQDSTRIQQRLISLLNGKYNNFIRCGDFNQAITSTFTNSDIESFKIFTETNKKVEMTSSQRCAKPIYTLANRLINEACNNEKTTNAFYKTQIIPAEKNPQSEKEPEYNIFDTDKEEKLFIIQKIKNIMQTSQSCSIAILLRLNSQVNEYNELFLAHGIKTSVRTDCLSQKNIYKIIYALLQVIQNPFNNSFIIDLAQIYKQNNIYAFSDKDFEYLKSLNIPFSNLQPDEINNEGLLQLYWDIDYWLNNSSLNINTLVINIGMYYSKNTTDKSNSYMVSTLLKRLISEQDSFEEAVKKLDYAAKKPLSSYKFFDDINQNSEKITVNIMTMHKSKGDEFDYVFIPELDEENYPINIENVKLKSSRHFIQTIRKNIENKEIKSPLQLKKEQVNETLRLLYVGITRAKIELYISAHKKSKKNKNIKISELFYKLLKI